jgi:hypothetical protein
MSKDDADVFDDGEILPVPADQGEVTFAGVSFPVTWSEADPEVVQQRIMGRLFAAETLDQAFDVWEGDSSDALVGKTYEILEVAWMPYEAVKEDGSTKTIPLAEVSAVNCGTGEKETWTTTATNLTGFLAWAENHDKLPFKARIQGELTRRGRTVLRFARP